MYRGCVLAAAAQDTSSICGPLLHVSPVTQTLLYMHAKSDYRHQVTWNHWRCMEQKTSELISTESLFSSDTSHHPATKLVLCERRPTASPVSRHVLVRPGIFCLWLRAVLQFPPPLHQKAKGSIAPLQHGSQRTVSPPPSSEKCKMTHSRVSFMGISILCTCKVAWVKGDDVLQATLICYISECCSVIEEIKQDQWFLKIMILLINLD